MWIDNMFGVKKPIITMLHLDPLPGDPRYYYGDCMDRVVEHARADLHALQDGGVDGIMFSNEFSLPYERHMSFVTPAAMARVIGELKSEIRVPYGVDCISDGLAAIELAAAVDAKFIRGTFSGVYVGDGGLYNNDFSQLLRRKAALHLDELKMLYFINPESDRNLDTRPLADIARSTIFKAHPDGLCISANAAGQDVDDALIASVKEIAPNVAAPTPSRKSWPPPTRLLSAPISRRAAVWRTTTWRTSVWISTGSRSSWTWSRPCGRSCKAPGKEQP